jgi:hypothetical protein
MNFAIFIFVYSLLATDTTDIGVRPMQQTTNNKQQTTGRAYEPLLLHFSKRLSRFYFIAVFLTCELPIKMVQISRSRNSSSGNTSFFHFIVTALLCAISFYTGNLSSFTTCDCPLSNSNTNVAGNSQVVEQKVDEQKIEAIVQQRLQAGK